MFFSQFGSEEYQTGATLLVDGGTEPTIFGRERDVVPGNLRDYMRTLTSRIRSLKTLTLALERLPENQWPSFLDPERPPIQNAIELFKHIQAFEENRTYLINVRISADSGESLGVALNTVIETFLEELAVEQEQRFSRRLEYLRAEEEKVARRIEGEKERVAAMATDVGNKAFLHKGYDLHYSALEKVQALYWDARNNLLGAQTELDRALKNREDFRTMSVEAYADDRVMDNFGINRIEMWTYEQLQQMRASIDGLTPENPERRYVDKRMEAMTEYLREYKASVSEETIRIISETRAYELDAEVIRAENRVDARKEEVEKLGRDLDRARKEAARCVLRHL